MSERHREGLAHLLYGVQQPGGFIQLTGEIGCGKTTLCRCLVGQLPPDTDIALILNPRLTVIELLAAFCDELRIQYPTGTESVKVLIDALNRHLLEAHAGGRRTVLVIDEAQNLDRDVLEQIRLLTNLETEQEKLLQIILIGQPELITILNHPSLRQLAQRITARYHLSPLSKSETFAYVRHRLFVAGRSESIFSKQALGEIFRLTHGVPRLINILCDRALLGAYALDRNRVGKPIIRHAGREIRSKIPRRPPSLALSAAVISLCVLLAAAAVIFNPWDITGLARNLIGMESKIAGGDSTDGSFDPEKKKSIMESSETGSSILSGAPHPATEDKTTIPASGRLDAGPDAKSKTAASFADGASETKPAPATPQFEEIVSDPSLQFSLVDSFNSLFSVWSVPVQIKPSEIGCHAGRAYGFECLFMTGDWLKLRRLDIPAILRLQMPNGEIRHLALIGLHGNIATIMVGNRKYSYPIREIDRLWDHSFIVIWNPPFKATMLPFGMQGEEIAWVNQTLDIYEGKARNPSPSLIFDENLKRRIMDFQKTQLLIEDGRIGPETLIRLALTREGAGIPLLSRYANEREKS